MSFFPNQINGLQPSHTTPRDGNAVFTTNTTITLSDFEFTVDDANAFILYVLYKPSGGQWQQPLMNGINGISIVAAANILTVAGGGTPFASGDTYFIGILEVAARQRGFDTSTDTVKGNRSNPEWSHHLGQTLADETNVTDGAYEIFVDMDNYPKGLNLQLILNGGSGTVTVTTEVSALDDGTPPDSVPYIDKTLEIWGLATFTADDYLFDNGSILKGVKWVKIRVVANTGLANDADYTIYSKKL